MIGGALNGIADWYRADGELSVETIADEFALRLTEGLAASELERGFAGSKPLPKTEKLDRRDRPSDRRKPDTSGGDR